MNIQTFNNLFIKNRRHDLNKQDCVKLLHEDKNDLSKKYKLKYKSIFSLFN